MRTPIKVASAHLPRQGFLKTYFTQKNPGINIIFWSDCCGSVSRRMRQYDAANARCGNVTVSATPRLLGTYSLFAEGRAIPTGSCTALNLPTVVLYVATVCRLLFLLDIYLLCLVRR